MSRVERPFRTRLRPAEEHFRVRPVASLAEACAALDPERRCWGYLATPAEIRFLYRPGAEWREMLEQPTLVEARVFHLGVDLHWLDGRGVLLQEVTQAQLETGPPPDTISVGGDGWMARDRRSRLWGEYLEGSDAWYEEAIPDPWRYEGVDPGRHHRYVFLHYCEYVRHGTVEWVRFLRLQGATR